MIAVNAKIQQTKFVVLSSSIKTHIVKEDTSIDLSKIPIDTDYQILTHQDQGPHTARVVLTINGNSTKAVSGYVFELRFGAEYKLAEEIDPESREYADLLHFSALTCVINEARTYLQAQTAFFPFGSYIMPMIDMQDLVRQKAKLPKSEEAKKS